MNDKTEPEGISPLNSGNIAHTLCDHGTTKLLYTYPSDSNVQLNNFPVGMRFRSKTEAIEKLCLQVFCATPIYETDIEGLKTEEKLKKDLKVINEAYTDLGEMYSKIVAVSLECDPIPAKDRDDGKIEPPWEVFARIKRERDQLLKQLDSERTLAERLEQENADTFMRRWAKAQERAIAAERALRKVWYIMDTIEGNDAVDEWQNKYSKYIESDYISCADCDALASHEVNDGPCEKHK